jgi:hypothetical protein
MSRMEAPMPKAPSLAALLLVLVVVSGARGDSPRDVVIRALAAAGITDPDQPMALRYRYRLTDGDKDKMLVEVAGDAPGKAARLAISEEASGRQEFLLVTHGVHSWKQERNEAAADLAGRELTIWLEVQHTERVLWLVPLIQDPRFTLKAAGVSRHAGREVVGVRVSYPRRRDVLLFFDRGSGRLARAQYQWSEAYEGKTVVQEFRDYRAVDGDAADRKVLGKVSRTLDPAVLLQFLRSQTPDSASGVRVAALIRQLGDDSFAVRQKASAAIGDEGTKAVPWLRQASHSVDPEVARRAGEAYRRLGGATVAPQVRAAARVLGRKKPPGAAEVLLAYLARCQDPDDRRELQAALMAVAHRDGRPDPALLKAYEGGPEPSRKFAAAALGRDGGAYARQPGRRLYLPGLTGLKVAHRMTLSIEKEKVFDLELLDLQVFNDNEERLFARPVAAPTN